MGMPPRQQGRGGHRPSQTGAKATRPANDGEAMSPIFREIDLVNLSADLFDAKAKAFAQALRQGGRNSTTQIRKFYNEMLRYEMELRGQDNPTAFERRLPFLRMLNARAAYAKERGHVDQEFVAFLKTMLNQVRDYPTLSHACTLFEAVLGFSPRK